MFPTRAPVPPGSSSSYKLSIPDTCDRIKEEYSYIQQQTHSYHVEREKIMQERGEMQRLCIMYYEMAHGLNLEMHRQMEIAKRLNAILNQLIPYLSQEHQSQITTAIDRAKQVTMQELNSAMMHTEEAKCSKFFNGGNFGFPDQLEFYKQIASNPLLVQHMLSAVVNNPSGGGPNAGGSSSSTSNNTSAPGIPSLPLTTAGNTPSSSLPPHASQGSNSNSNHNANSSNSLQPPPPPPLPPIMSSGSMPTQSLASSVSTAMSSNSSSSGGPPNMPPNSMAQGAAVNFFANLMASTSVTGGTNNGNSSLSSSALQNNSNGNNLLLPPGSGVPPNLLSGLCNNPSSTPTTTSSFTNSSGGPPQLTHHHNSNNNPANNFPHNSATSNAFAAAVAATGGNQVAANILLNAAAVASAANNGGTPPNTLNLASALLKQEAERHMLNDENIKKFSRPPSANDKLQNHLPEMSDRKRQLIDEDHYDISPRSVGSSTPVTNKRKMIKNALDLSQTPGGVMGSLYNSDGYPTTGGSAPATPATSIQIPSLSVNKSSKSHSGKSIMQVAKKHYNFVVKPNGVLEPRIVPLDPHPDMRDSSAHTSGKCSPHTPPSQQHHQYPQQLRHLASFQHGEVVCAVAMHQHTVYSGGKGTLKLWDVNSTSNPSDVLAANNNGGSPSVLIPTGGAVKDPLASLACLNSDSYIRSIKLINGVAAVIGGETNIIDIWDMSVNGNPVKKGEVKIDAPACYALTVAPDGKTCYSCFSDGHIAMIDLHNRQVVNQFQAHGEGASCIEISPCGTYLWTGGLDSTVRAWDIRDVTRELKSQEFHAQIFSIGLTNTANKSGSISGGYDWLAVGLENSDIDLVRVSPLDGSLTNNNSRSSTSTPANITSNSENNVTNTNNRSTSSPLLSSSSTAGPEHYRLQLHENCVLSLRFAHLSDWFITTSKDHLINAITCPNGVNILQTKEAGSVLTSDISSDDKYVVTGSGDKKATLYDVIYHQITPD